jgi:hypothetical protein
VPEVGTVVGGLLAKGVISEGAKLVIGNSIRKQGVLYLQYAESWFMSCIAVRPACLALVYGVHFLHRLSCSYPVKSQ